MEFFRNTTFDFCRHRYVAIILSLVIIVSGIISMIAKGGLNLGVDFKGGVLLEVSFSKMPQIDEVRSALKTINLEDSIIQQVHGRNDLIIRIKEENITKENKVIYEEVKQKISKVLEEKFGKDSFGFERVEYVGPTVGKDLREKAFLATIFSCLGIIIYLSFRFEFKFGIAAIVAIAHDVLITLTFFSFLNKEFNTTILAAVLAVIGYSVNDTIVVFDRIRENSRLHAKKNYIWMINKSLNDTLSRMVLTGMTTFISIVILFLLGGPVIHDFAFALMIGIITGTYSSIYIATPVLIDWNKLILKKKLN
ncbi:MAG: protein translocase subunit SecF [bacterium]